MDEYEMKSRIYGYVKEISHYSQMQVFATSYYQKNYFQMQVDDAVSGLISIYMDRGQSLDGRHVKRQYHKDDQEQDISCFEQEQDITCFEQEQYIHQEHDDQSEEHQTLLDQQAEQAEQAEQPPWQVDQNQPQELRKFTKEELAGYDGVNGRAAYVAVNGFVYDVSGLLRWEGGKHFGLNAGKDLSGAFMGCHLGVMDRLQKLPRVGVLIE